MKIMNWIILVLILGIIGLLWLIYMALVEPNQLVVKHITFVGDVKKPVTLLHFSDTHVKANSSEKQMKKLIETINQEQADFVIFTGDLMDSYETAPGLRASLPPKLAQMHANIAKIAVYGNHDIGGKARSVYRPLMEEGEFQVLCNEIIPFEEEGLAFFGIDDPQAGYEDRDFVKQKFQPYQILLSHEPDLFDELDLSFLDLMLSGHTHGGQIYLPILSNYILPTGGKHYRKGLYQKGSTTLSVSSGIGMTWLPLRFCNQPEVLVYQIQPK